MSDPAAGGLGADRRDVLAALLAALCVLVGGLALDAWVASRAPAGTRPVGVVADPHLVAMTAIYGSFAREAAEGGGLLVHNHQTPEPHPPSQARPWDLLTGEIAALFGGGPRAVFLVDRVLATLLFPLALVLFLGECVRSRAVRRGALVLACTGGSLYWIWAVWPAAPLRGVLVAWLDGPMRGLDGLGFAFPALLVGVPHLVLELVFLLAAAGFLLRAGRRPSAWTDALVGLSVVGLCSVRPYSVPATLAFVGAVLALRLARARDPGARLRVARAAALGVLPVVPLLAHYYRVVRGGGVFSGLDVYHPAPALHEQLLFTGLPGLVALLLAVPAVRRRTALGSAAAPELGWLLAAWLAATLVVVHGESLPAPFTIGWEVEGMLSVPLLALLGAALVLDALPPRARTRALAALVALQVVPTLVWVGEVGERARDPRAGLLIRADEGRALEWLAAHRPPDALTADEPPVVLVCAPSLAPLVPWLAGVRVWSGHPDHTVDGGRKAELVASFLRDGNGARALAERGATHVLLGPRERELREVAPEAFAARALAGAEVVLRDGAGQPLLARLAR